MSIWIIEVLNKTTKRAKWEPLEGEFYRTRRAAKRAIGWLDSDYQLYRAAKYRRQQP